MRLFKSCMLPSRKSSSVQLSDTPADLNFSPPSSTWTKWARATPWYNGDFLWPRFYKQHTVSCWADSKQLSYTLRLAPPPAGKDFLSVNDRHNQSKHGAPTHSASDTNRDDGGLPQGVWGTPPLRGWRVTVLFLCFNFIWTEASVILWQFALLCLTAVWIQSRLFNPSDTLHLCLSQLCCLWWMMIQRGHTRTREPLLQDISSGAVWLLIPPKVNITTLWGQRDLTTFCVT